MLQWCASKDYGDDAIEAESVISGSYFRIGRWHNGWRIDLSDVDVVPDPLDANWLYWSQQAAKDVCERQNQRVARRMASGGGSFARAALMKFATAFGIAILFPVLLVVCAFAFAILTMGNDEGASLMMAVFFFGVPVATLVGFAAATAFVWRGW